MFNMKELFLVLVEVDDDDDKSSCRCSECRRMLTNAEPSLQLLAQQERDKTATEKDRMLRLSVSTVERLCAKRGSLQLRETTAKSH